MEKHFDAYVYSMKVELKKGRKLPILNFQFSTLAKAIANETGVNLDIVVKDLTSFFSCNAISDISDKVALVILTKFETGNR